MRVKFGVLEQTHGLHLQAKFHLNVFIVSASAGQKRQFWANFDICDARVWTTHEGHLVVFITVQNLVLIDTVVSIIGLCRPRWGGWSSYYHMCRSFLNLTVKTALKSIDFGRSHRQKYVGSFLWPTVYSFIFLNNSVKIESIWIIFGKWNPEKISHQNSINLPT